MSLLNTLASENYFIVNRDLVRNLGLESAVMIGELASEYNYFQKHNELIDGWFYSTLENIEERTTLSKYNQNKIINKLKEKGILETKLKGVPARRYIKINEKELANYLKQDSKKIDNLDSKNFNHLDSKKIDHVYKSNKEKNNNKNISSSSKEKVVDLLQSNGFIISPLQYETIDNWLDYDYELIKYALLQSLNNNIRNINYIDKVLLNYSKKGITTKEQAIADDEAFKKKKKGSTQKEEKDIGDYYAEL